MAERTPRAGRSWPRTVVEVVVAAVALVGLLWGADTLARLGAESLLARNVRDAVGAEGEPQVRVEGRFFLPQVIRGAYEEVHVTTTGVSAGPLRIERVDSTLLDVRVPFHDVLLRDIRAVGIGRSEQQAVLTYADLNAYFAATGRTLQVTAGPEGQVGLAGTVGVLGRRLDLTADAEVGAGDGQLTIRPTRVDTSRSTDGATGLLLAQRLRLSVPMGTLPFGQQLTAVDAGPESIAITATGRQVVLEP